MFLISVIIPYYKNSATIERALKSVLNQTFQDFEILLINDASPDWPLAKEKLDLFKSEKFKIHHHTNNRNGAAARNTGIKNARGKYAAFLDADDEWVDNHLELSLRKQKETKADLVYCKAQIFSNISYVMPVNEISQREKVGDYLFVKQQAIYTPTIFVLSTVAKAVLFNEKLKRHQDYDFLLKLDEAGYKVRMSTHLGAKIHWEDNIPEVKGGTWEFSLRWVKEYQHYLSKDAYSNFVFQFVFLKLLKQRKIKQALQIGCKEFNWLRITRRNLFLLAFILFYEPFKKKV